MPRPTESALGDLSRDDRGDRDDRDVRTGGTWTRGQRLKNDVLFVVAMLALAVSRALPLWALRRVGRAAGAAAHAVARRARKTAEQNVARVFPDMPEAERRAFVRRTFLTMGELLSDAAALLRRRGGPLLDVTPESKAVLDAALREGRGVLFASAHLGPWERVAASLAAAGLPFTALARESYDPRFSRLYAKLRAARGVRMVWRPTSRSTRWPLAMIRTLRDGGMLGVPMDLRSRVASCDAPFLGHSAPTPVGPARMALRTGAVVVVGTVAPGASGPTGGPPLVITATRVPTDGLDSFAEQADAARELTARINGELSSRIRALPHAWVWMHDRWTAPNGYGDTLKAHS